MDEKARFVHADALGIWTMTELCERFSISRKTGYKWRHRYREEGLEGIKEQSRAPHNCPHRTPPEVEELICDMREDHPKWGARKILRVLSRRHEGIILPSISTGTAILKRHGLIKERKRRRKFTHPGARVLDAREANDVWTIDYKGQFKLKNGKYCYPLTVCDGCTRYLVCCHGFPSTEMRLARKQLERVFRENGLPVAILSDNGVPFVGNGWLGLSKLNVWWMSLGIRHDRIRPASPQDNGRHERMHRTLKKHTVFPPADGFKMQQERFDAFKEEYNHVRPHQGIGDEVPASLWTASKRTYPRKAPEPAYELHLEVRRVCQIGFVKFKGHRLMISQALTGERVAFEEVEDGIWNLYFYDVLLAKLDERTFELSY